MEEKQKLNFSSLLQNLTRSRWWQSHKLHAGLVAKSLAFGFLLWYAAAQNFRPFSLAVYVIVAMLMYSRPLFVRAGTWYAFFVLVPVAVLGMRVVEGSFLFVPTIVVFSLVFYLLCGVRSVLFVARSRMYFIASLLLFYAMFIVFFLADKSELFFFKYGLVVLASFALFREWLAMVPSFHFPKRERAAAAVSALLTAQLLWAVALLPIGFISASNSMLVFVFLAADLLFHHFMGRINKTYVAQIIVLFLALSALIFWTSQWTIVN